MATPTDKLLLVDYLKNPQTPDDQTREVLISACEDVIAALETPIETARKNAFRSLDHAVVRSAIQLDIFRLLGDKESYSTTQELASATTPPCEAVLLSRLLRYLASPLRLIIEDGPDRWKSTRRGAVLADQGFQAGCVMYFDSCGLAFQALPSWICTEPSPQIRTPFHAAFPKELGYFPWLQKDDTCLQAFHTWMDVLARYQMTRPSSINISEWIPDDLLSGGVAFVDVGGGTGGQCIALREQRGSQKGRIVNQDRAEVTETARVVLESKGIEAMEHDFLLEQPIKGTPNIHLLDLRTRYKQHRH